MFSIFVARTKEREFTVDNKMKKSHYTLEYRDNDGDLVVKHLFLNKKETKNLVKKMLKENVSFSLINHSNVKSSNEFVT